MDNKKEPAATDAAKEQQDVRQFVEHEQPRQVPRSEPAPEAPEPADTG